MNPPKPLVLEWQREVEAILTPQHSGNIVEAGTDRDRRAQRALAFIERHGPRLVAAALVLHLEGGIRE